MPPQVYHVLHITGIIMLFMGYGALLARSMVRNASKELKRLGSITSGIGLVLNRPNREPQPTGESDGDGRDTGGKQMLPEAPSYDQPQGHAASSSSELAAKLISARDKHRSKESSTVGS